MNYKKTKLIFLAIIFFGVFGLVKSSEAADWYVDNTASGSNNGTSWANAWESFGDINYSTVSCGDTIYISGGSTSKTYAERLSVGKSCTQGSPLTITVGIDSGHNGTVKITGMAGYYSAISISSKDWITIDGQSGGDGQRHIEAYNANGCTTCANTGVSINGTSVGTIIKYLYIHNIGAIDNDYHVAISLGVTNATYAHDHEIAYNRVENTIDCINTGYAGSVKSTSYGGVKIHHNTIACHDDGIQASVSTDIYNNDISRDEYVGKGHPDGIQAYGSYVRIYNNYFHGFLDYASGNSVIYWEPDGAENMDINEHAPSNFMVYNNVFSETNSASSLFAIMLGLSDSRFTSISDLYILNNTFKGNYDATIILSLGNTSHIAGDGDGKQYLCILEHAPAADKRPPTGAFWTTYWVETTMTGGATYPGGTLDGVYKASTILDKSAVTDFHIENNIFYNATKSGNAALALAKPFYITTSPDYGSHGSGDSTIVDYNIYGGTGGANVSYLGTLYTYADFKTASGCQGTWDSTVDPTLDATLFPLAGSTAIDYGVLWSSLFTTDKSSTARPQGAAWDIGAYEYVSGADTTPPAAPQGLSVS